jgi:hypothetical protein
MVLLALRRQRLRSMMFTGLPAVPDTDGSFFSRAYIGATLRRIGLVRRTRPRWSHRLRRRQGGLGEAGQRLKRRHGVINGL